jgi:Flp pilus assembly protein TadG
MNLRRQPGLAHERGFVLIAMSVTMLLLLAVMGLAFDIGRIYIARNEAQVFTDAAALTAASKLDGTAAGIARARESAEHLPMRWNLGTTEFTGVIIEFSKDGSAWDSNPKEPAEMTMARVIVPSNRMEITFLRAVGGPSSLNVAARSVASTKPVRLTE